MSTALPAIGTSGISFGNGAFAWKQHADGTWGWEDPTSGRSWDAIGNPYQTTPSSTTGQQPVQQMTTGYVAPSVTPTTTTAQQNALQQNIDRGQQILAGLPDPQKVNVASYLRLPKSVQDVVLSGYEARGYDKGDIAEQFQRMLPTATGPKRGYIAPMGAN
jgi:hypothetical protein